ncbi:VTT domain-containing protein [Candidatus Pacearchaeota archaeon]|nr:VTT domain-containing protein [Candidatus Pacearchaeota archaeon]
MNKKIKGLIEIIIVIVLFIWASYVVQTNLDYFENLVVNDFAGIIVFIFIEIISIVIAPVTTLPLIAVASNLWGWFFTGLINIFSWTIGAWIAFILGRKYGYKIIKRFISLEKIHNLEKKIPQEHLFWSVVLFRIILPVDVLSYALGIFTKIKLKNYLLATIIGITPFAFVIAYLGKVPFYYQIVFFEIAFIIFAVWWVIKSWLSKKISN